MHSQPGCSLLQRTSSAVTFRRRGEKSLQARSAENWFLAAYIDAYVKKNLYPFNFTVNSGFFSLL